jgi:pilus assembly protein FimV
MLRLVGLTLLTLCLAVPTASRALGLGDIHVESALHQALVAQIELVGASDDELGRLKAAIANDETFQRYALERPAFITGTTLVVARDGQGHPVLNLRSTEKFTEPVVTLLVDLHTPGGELIREYTLFLDPPGLTPTASTAAASEAPASGLPASGVPASNVSAASGAPIAGSFAAEQTYTVARRDTLAHIVSATGARSRIDRHRMMIAIFRANPAAFHSNFNRLHTGVTLHFPGAEQLAALSTDEVNREYEAQMEAWRAPGHRINPTDPQPARVSTDAASANAATPTRAADRKSNIAALETGRAMLTQRVASLEQSLDELRQELKQPPATQHAATSASQAAQQAAPGAATQGPPILATAAASMGTTHAPPTPAAAVTPAVASRAPVSTNAAAPIAAAQALRAPEAAPRNHKLQVISMVAGVGLLFLTAIWFYLRARNSSPHSATATHNTRKDSDATAAPIEISKPPAPLPQAIESIPFAIDAVPGESQPAAAKPAKGASSWFEDSFSTPIAELLANDPTINLAPEATVEIPADETVKLASTLPPREAADTTVLLAPDFEVVGDTAERKFSFFNPEETRNTEHVVMGDGLHEPKPFVERRKNPADVLRQAIEREPDRSDLRLKLLELYYTAAAENRQAFLIATRQLAKNERLASTEDWSRIADMGRTIAPDDELFSDELDDKRVAKLLSA